MVMEEGEFVGYVGDSRIHDATVVKIQRDDQLVIVTLRNIEGHSFGIRFRGIESVKANRAQGMVLYSLSEVTAPQPWRRFVFTNWDEKDDASLEILAEEMSIVEVPVVVNFD